MLHPVIISGLRYVIASAILMGYLLARRTSVRLSLSEVWQVAALGFVMLSVNTTLLNYGGSILSAGVIALFLAMIPLFIAIFEALLPGGARMSREGWVGVVF
jgi:drug/metabolite transporter (DMT)-like permease